MITGHLFRMSNRYPGHQKKAVCMVGIIGTLLFCLTLAGCGRSHSYVIPDALALRLTENPTTLDPAFVVDVTGGELVSKLYGGLVRFNAAFQIVPELAESVTRMDQGKRYRVQLKENLQFSDGSPLTTDDVIFSFERVLAPETLSPRRWVLDKISGAKDFMSGNAEHVSGLQRINKVSLDILLDEPFSPFLSLLTMPAAMVVSKAYALSPDADLDHRPLSSGPYTLEVWKHDVRIRLLPNTYYQGLSKRATRLHYRIIPEEATALGMISTGELDIIKVPGPLVEALKKKVPHEQFLSIEELNTYFIGFDHRKSYIDKNLKLAVAHLVDRRAWIDSIFGGQAKPAISPVPPVLLHGLSVAGLPDLSPEKARRYFSKSIARDRELVLLVSSSRETVAVASILQDKLKSLGANIRLKTLDWSAFKEALGKGEGDIFYLSWWADYADAENFLFPTFHSKNHGSAGNRVYYSNAKMDNLLGKLHQSVSTPAAAQILADITDLIVDELPWIPLWHKTAVYQVSPRVGGFSPAPMYSMDKGLNLYRK